MTEYSVRSFAVGLLMAGALSAAPINLIGNHSFENDPVAPGQIQCNSFLNGCSWQVFAAVDRWGIGYPSYGVELQANNLYGGIPSNGAGGNNAWDGSQLAELDYLVGNSLILGQTATPQVYQDISTVPGASYLLSFYYTPRPDGGTQQLGIFWGEAGPAAPALVATTDAAQGASSLNWVKIEFPAFMATGLTMRIGLGSLANNAGSSFAGGNLIDVVSLTRVEGTTLTGATEGGGTTAGGTTAGGTTAGGTTAGGTTAGGTTAGGTTAGGTTAGGTTDSGTTLGGTTLGGGTTDPGGDVPEPAAYLMVGLGLAAFALVRKQRG